VTPLDGQEREALAEIADQARHALLTQDKAPQALNAKWVLDRCRAALAAREEPATSEPSDVGKTWTPTIRDALTDLLTWVQQETSNYSDEERDVLVRQAIDALAAREEPQGDEPERPATFTCERCGEREIPPALAYQTDGDGRLYCSEKCMGKPGEAGDVEQEHER
jgi:hypothetical protein